MGGGTKKDKQEEGPPIPATTEAKIQQFCLESHTEGGKTVQAHEMITMRSETIGESLQACTNSRKWRT